MQTSLQRKLEPTRKVETYKARLIEKGYTQNVRIDCEKTFSPVAMLKTKVHKDSFVNCILSLLDMKNGCKNCILKLIHPRRKLYGPSRSLHILWAWIKSMQVDGLKQALCSWNIWFDESIMSFGFSQNMDEPCVYKKGSGSILTFLILLFRWHTIHWEWRRSNAIREKMVV